MDVQADTKSIVFYIGSLSRGGAERVIVNLAEYFCDHGYRVIIVTKERTHVEYPIPENVTRMLADITEDEITSSRIRNLYRRIKKLRHIFKQLKPDHIVSFIKKNNFMAVTAAAGLKIPVIVSVRSNPAREYPDRITKVLANVLFSKSAGVVLQTKQAKTFFSKKVQKKAVILPNSLSKQFLRERHEGKRRKEVVWVGRMDANKNPDMLLSAFVKIAPKYPDWTLRYVGDGPQLVKLKEKCQNMSYEKQVVFEGHAEDVASLVQSASVFVLTSRQEGMPNALMEAMVSGLAVIATDCPCGGPAELIENDVNGILIPVDDETELTANLERLMEKEEYRNRLGEEAAKLIQKVHPDVVNRQWMEYIESVKG